MREDVSAVLFDEPLTVIDPHLKWQLRRKLKQIHQELKLTLIYVTHDQVEALTFAEQVVVMTRGRAVQMGSASELFERPSHRFVGHFIGSPGMNFLPARMQGETLLVAGSKLNWPAGTGPKTHIGAQPFSLGVRPEYVDLCDPHTEGALLGQVVKAQDIGTHWLITAVVGEGTHQAVSDDAVGTDETLTSPAALTLRARLSPHQTIPAVGQAVWLRVLGEHSCCYVDEELLP